MNLFNIVADSNLCTSEAGYRLFGLAGYAIKFIQIAVPIILIIMGTIDLVKALVAQSDDKIKKAQGTLIKRTITAVIIFFIPMIVSFVIGMAVTGTNNTECYSSFKNPEQAIEKANTLKKSHSSSSGNSSTAVIISEADCESQGKILLKDSIDINLHGTNCIKKSTNMGSIIRQVNG